MPPVTMDDSGSLNMYDYSKLENDRAIMELLLKDNSTGSSLVWGTDDYNWRGPGFESDQPMNYLFVTLGGVIRPRTLKTVSEQRSRSREMAEVFTPPWVVNKQNNMADNQWVGRTDIFNHETDRGWKTTARADLGEMPWEEYVRSERLEVCCGEAPYLTTRYDAVSGQTIPVRDRVGFLDRKLRIIGENVSDPVQWRDWAKVAFQNTYGYDYQGDNVLLSRENLLLSYIDQYEYWLNEEPPRSSILDVASIISWNIWQMDGFTCTVPHSCDRVSNERFVSSGLRASCPACKNGRGRHIGTYSRIKDWKAGRTITFESMMATTNAPRKNSLESTVKNVLSLDNW